MIQRYTVTSYPDYKTCTTTGTLSCSVLGLRNGETYIFTITATNSTGTSSASLPSNAITISSSNLLFNIVAMGSPLNVTITLCLNGRGPLSCQVYGVNASDLYINTNISNRAYPAAGIKVNQPGYTVAGCSSIENGYCLFSLSNTDVKLIAISRSNSLVDETMTTSTNTDKMSQAKEGSSDEQVDRESDSKNKDKTLSLRDLTCTIAQMPLCTVSGLADKIPFLVSIIMMDKVEPKLIGAPNSAKSKIHSSIKSQSTDIPPVNINPMPSFFVSGWLSHSVYRLSFSNKNLLETAYPDPLFNVALPAIPIIWDFPQGIIHESVSIPSAAITVIQAIHCYGNGCVATGYYRDEEDMRHLLFARSLDNGLTWDFLNIIPQANHSSAWVSNGVLQAVHCREDGCVASGYYTDEEDVQHPLLAYSLDHGLTWDFSNSMSQPNHNTTSLSNGVLQAVHCSADGCVASGYYTDEEDVQHPLLANSLDHGLTWDFSNSMTQPNLNTTSLSNGVLQAVHCSEEGCVASGYYTDAENVQHPLLAYSLDHGLTWDFSNSIEHLNGVLQAVYCSEEGCFATGFYINGMHGQLPLLASSKDHGLTWSFD